MSFVNFTYSFVWIFSANPDKFVDTIWFNMIDLILISSSYYKDVSP